MIRFILNTEEKIEKTKKHKKKTIIFEKKVGNFWKYLLKLIKSFL